MKDYALLKMPQQVYYGRGAFEKMGAVAKEQGKKVLLISDHIIEELGYVKESKEQLEAKGLAYEVYLGVKSEPNDDYVKEALALFLDKKCDVIVSIGGGSCIDTAKAVAVLATNNGDISEYMNNQKEAAQRSAPHIAIPTTAGTGSEATDVTVITNMSNQEKMMIKQQAFLPVVAIVDPLLTMSAPKSVTAATGVDALSHSIEAYISRLAHPMSDMMALSAMKLITKNLLTAYENPRDVYAREQVSLGALQGGIAFSNASVCLVHGLSRPIGALFDVPHGFSNAMLLPAVLEFSKEACIERLADLGRIFADEADGLTNEEAADVAVTSIKELCAKLNIPNLKEWGIDEAEFEASIPKMAEDALRSGSPANNPLVPTKKQMEELYRVCFHYEFKTENM